MTVSRSRNYLKGLASGYVVTISTVAVGLFMVPFTLRFLDREQYAIFTLAGDVLMWLGLLEIGITAVLNVRAAQMSGGPQAAKLNQLASTTFVAQCVIAGCIGLLGLAVSAEFPAFFGLRPDLYRDATNLMLLLVAGSALQVGTQTFSAILVAHQQIHIDNLIRLVLLVLRTGMTIAFLEHGLGLLSLGLAHVLAVAISGMLAVARVFRLLPTLELNLRHFDLPLLKQTTGTGIWFSLGGLAGILIMNLDKILSAKLVGIEVVTSLALTGRLYAIGWTLLQQVANTARPALAQMIGAGQRDRAMSKYTQLRFLTMGMALVTASSIWACNGSFVRWWVGEPNYAGTLVDTLLAANLLAHAWSLPNRAILVAGLAYIPQNAISRFAEGILNLALSVALGWIYGLPGVIAATALAAACVSVWYFPSLTVRYFETTWAKLYADTGKRLLLLAVFVVAGAAAGRWVSLSVTGFAGAVVAAMLCGCIGAVGAIVTADKALVGRLRHLQW
jgi:O-antigen/teichoic acid export membrane protein